MQIGVFSVSDITRDPITGRIPTEHERIKAAVTIAKKVEDIGMDVRATGEHHNPPFYASSPTTLLGYIAAQTERIILSTATTLITTNDPVKIAENFATLQHLSDGRVDLVLGRGNTAPVYPWFGKNMQDSVELTIENYSLLRDLELYQCRAGPDLRVGADPERPQPDRRNAGGAGGEPARRRGNRGDRAV